jgi:hypothetical protein
MLTVAPAEIAAASHPLQISAASVLSMVDFTRIQSLSQSSALKRHAAQLAGRMVSLSTMQGTFGATEQQISRS